MMKRLLLTGACVTAGAVLGIALALRYGDRDDAYWDDGSDEPVRLHAWHYHVDR